MCSFGKGFLLFFLVVYLHDSAVSVCPGDNNISLPQDLQFGLLTAADNRLRFVSVGCIPAIELAVELINEDDTLLSGYNLTHNPYIDTGCDRRVAYDRFFDFVESDYPPSIAIIGAGCSTASEPVAEIAPFWSVPVIAYVSASPLLSDRLRYPNFYRTYISDSLIAPAFVTLTESFGWRRLFIISENEPVFVENIREQVELLEMAGIRVTQFRFDTEMFNGSRLDSAIEDEDHVFFINTFEDAARSVLCYFYTRDRKYPSYAFMTHAWYQELWYLQNTTNCDPKEVESQLEYAVTFIPTIINEKRDEPTISGLSANQFDRTYRERLSYTELKYQPEAYTGFDAVYAMALALDNVQKAVCMGNNLGCNVSNLTDIEDFQYYNGQIECMMKASLNSVHFTGVSGPVKFDENGTRIVTTFDIKQYQTKTDSCTDNVNNIKTRLCHETIGLVSLINDSFRYLGNHSVTTVWPEGIPPDGKPIVEINTIHISLVVIMDVLAVAGIVIATICLVFNLVFRNKKIVKLTSPNLNYIIVVGAFFSYGSVFFRVLPGTDMASLRMRCQVSYVISLFGYTLSFSAVLAKMWRVFYIFHNPTTKKRSLKDWHLLALVGILSGIVALLLLIGESIPVLRQSPELVPDRETPDTKNDLNVVVTYRVYGCSDSSGSIVFEGVVYGYLFILQLVAVILAFQTRKVKIKALNDAKEVIAIIYITTVCLVVLVLTSFALSEYLNTTTTLYTLTTMVATTVFLGLIFLPKMISLYRDPKGENVFGTTENSSNHSSGIARRSSKPFLGGGLEDSKVLIQKLEDRVSQLKDELDTFETPPANNDVPAKRKITVKFKDNETYTEDNGSNGDNGITVIKKTSNGSKEITV